jgi:hypothetical protein
MKRRIIRSVLTLIAIVVVTTTMACSQSSTSFEVPLNDHSSWQAAHLTGPSKGKLLVVTVDRPDHKQTCHIQSFTPDKLVCSRALGGSRTYLAQEVIALILPGDEGLRLPLWIGFNGGLGASIWATVVLAAACPVCAAGTGIAALFFFSAAGVTAYADGQPDKLLYLAPGQELSEKIGYVGR